MCVIKQSQNTVNISQWSRRQLWTAATSTTTTTRLACHSPEMLQSSLKSKHPTTWSFIFNNENIFIHQKSTWQHGRNLLAVNTVISFESRLDTESYRLPSCLVGTASYQRGAEYKQSPVITKPNNNDLMSLKNDASLWKQKPRPKMFSLMCRKSIYVSITCSQVLSAVPNHISFTCLSSVWLFFVIISSRL